MSIELHKHFEEKGLTKQQAKELIEKIKELKIKHKDTSISTEDIKKILKDSKNYTQDRNSNLNQKNQNDDVINGKIIRTINEILTSRDCDKILTESTPDTNSKSGNSKTHISDLYSKPSMPDIERSEGTLR